MKGYLLVRAGGNRYGLRLEQVIEVFDGFEVSPAPAVHPAVRGVTHIRGQPVPLVHLSSLVANEPAPVITVHTAVLTRCLGSPVAFEVDDAEAVASEGPVAVPDAWQLPWVCGVIRTGVALVPIIDLDVLGERLIGAGSREEQ